jgi:hypothetical protein
MKGKERGKRERGKEGEKEGEKEGKRERCVVGVWCGEVGVCWVRWGVGEVG